MVARWAGHLPERKSILEFFQWLWQTFPGQWLEEVDNLPRLERTLDRFHGIDQMKLDRERRSMLDEFVSATEKVPTFNETFMANLQKGEAEKVLFTTTGLANGMAMDLRTARKPDGSIGIVGVLADCHEKEVGRTDIKDSFFEPFEVKFGDGWSYKIHLDEREFDFTNMSNA